MNDLQPREVTQITKWISDHAHAVRYEDREIACVMRDEMQRSQHRESRAHHVRWRIERCAACQAWHVREELHGWYLINPVSRS